jgi:hypothetical protein
VTSGERREVRVDHHEHADKADRSGRPAAPADGLAEEEGRERGDQNRGSEENRVRVGERQACEARPSAKGAGGGQDAAKEQEMRVLRHEGTKATKPDGEAKNRQLREERHDQADLKDAIALRR